MDIRKRLLFFVFFAMASAASAQTWEIGVLGGGSGYMGDLNPVKPYKLSDPAFGGLIKRNFNPIWGLRFSVLHGTIRSADRNSPNEQQRTRNLSFFTPITEFGLQLEFNFFNYIPSLSSKLYTPYLFTGVGEVVFNPKTTYNGETYELNLYGTEGQDRTKPYKKNALSIPYGVGFRYNIASKWSLNTELGYRTAFTDYLDDVSGRYPDQSRLINPTAVALSDRSGETSGTYIGIPGTQRGDFRKRDTYMFMGFSLTYSIISSKCPVVE